ncbi:MAG TPA: type 1 glutamine amidotransferase [Terriglobales bacterium]|nr:type 1 glutamine amidotransferase [Terriglobales bacterium]
MVSRRWACFQHVAHEGPGRVAVLTASRGIRLDIYRVDTAPSLVRLSDAEALVVMGGPMGVYETDQYPWLVGECARIREFVEAGRFVLGICLGAHLLAQAMGGTVFRGPVAEVGFGSVTLTEDAKNDPVFRRHESPLPVFHWHQDTFNLPVGAVLLASSEKYSNQAFSTGKRAYGLQFHVESDESLWQGWLPHLPAEIAGADTKSLRSRIQRAGGDLLGRLIDLADN